jgi:hypothetical protein
VMLRVKNMQSELTVDIIRTTVQNVSSELISNWCSKNDADPQRFESEYLRLRGKINKLKILFYLTAIVSTVSVFYSIYELFSYNNPSIGYFLMGIVSLVLITMPIGMLLWRVDTEMSSLKHTVVRFISDVESLGIKSSLVLDKERIYNEGLDLLLRAISCLSYHGPGLINEGPHSKVCIIYHSFDAYIEFTLKANSFGVKFDDEVIGQMMSKLGENKAQ